MATSRLFSRLHSLPKILFPINHFRPTDLQPASNGFGLFFTLLEKDRSTTPWGYTKSQRLGAGQLATVRELDH